jgi:GMP reductase
MKFTSTIGLDFQDVLILPKSSTLNSRNSVSIERTFKFRHTDKTWTGVPIIAANMDTVGTFEMAEAFYDYKMLTAIHKHYSIEDWKAFSEKHKNNKNIFNHIMISTGTSDNNYKTLKNIMEIIPEIPFICIDIANGYSDHLTVFVKQVRKNYPDKIIVAGNVVTGSMTTTLLDAGADIVKVGIGPGSVCTTRILTGVGRPQLSAILDCQDASKQKEGRIIGDGGCKCPGDVAKAFGAGADFVMLGGLLAGHDQSAGEIVEENGVQYKSFYGMSSTEAMNKHSNGVANYRASEGKCVKIKYRGNVENTIKKILGGLRSSCTYVGAKNIRELKFKVTFEKTNRQVNEVFGQDDWIDS